MVGHILDVDDKKYRTYAKSLGEPFMVPIQLQFIKKREHSVEELSSIVILYSEKGAKNCILGTCVNFAKAIEKK